MLTRLHESNFYERVGTVQQTKSFDQSRHVRNVLWFNRDLDDRRDLEHHVAKRRTHLGARQCSALQDVSFQTTDRENITGRYLLDSEHSLTHHEVKIFDDDLLAHVFAGIARIVRAIYDVQLVPFSQHARIYAAKT